MSNPAHPPRQAALAFIFVTVLIDMLAFGMIIPVLPLLVQNFAGGNAARGAEIYGACSSSSRPCKDRCRTISAGAP